MDKKLIIIIKMFKLLNQRKLNTILKYCYFFQIFYCRIICPQYDILEYGNLKIGDFKRERKKEKKNSMVVGFEA